MVKESIGNQKRGSEGRKAARAKVGIITVLCVLMLIAASAMVSAQSPPTPFLIYGWVKYSNGTEVLDPNVTIKNLNTPENYIVVTNASYSYYQVITSSWNVSDGDPININASDNVNSDELNPSVTPENMTDGGLFEQNLTIPSQPAGECGDVTDNGWTDMGDYGLLLNNVSFPGNPTYFLKNDWAGDVTGNSWVDMGDYGLLLNNVSFPGNPTYNLKCR